MNTLQMKLGSNSKVNSASYCLDIPKKRIYDSIRDAWLSPNATDSNILNAGHFGEAGSLDKQSAVVATMNLRNMATPIITPENCNLFIRL